MVSHLLLLPYLQVSIMQSALLYAGFIFPFLLNAMLNNVGLRWTLRIWAIGSTVITGVALLGIRPRLPVPRFTAGRERPRFIPPQLGLMRSPLFWSVVSHLHQNVPSSALTRWRI